MSITIVLPSNQELWKLKPNRETINIATENNDAIGKIVGLTSEKELREYLGNGTRITQYGHFDIYDVIAKIYGCSREQARCKFRDLRKSGQVPDKALPGPEPRPTVPAQSTEDALTQGIEWGKHQFPGDSNQTPVANYSNVRKITCLFPDEMGKAIRSRMANVAVRADVGDEDLENAIHERREKMSPHDQEILMNGMTSSEKTFKNREERKEETQRPRLGMKCTSCV
jgi:hypothetical protein